MVDAPYTGANVREDTFSTTIDSDFGGIVYVGATQPDAS